MCIEIDKFLTDREIYEKIIKVIDTLKGVCCSDKKKILTIMLNNIDTEACVCNYKDIHKYTKPFNNNIDSLEEEYLCISCGRGYDTKTEAFICGCWDMPE